MISSKISLAGAAVLKYTIEEQSKVGLDGEGANQSCGQGQGNNRHILGVIRRL